MVTNGVKYSQPGSITGGGTTTSTGTASGSTSGSRSGSAPIGSSSGTYSNNGKSYSVREGPANGSSPKPITSTTSGQSVRNLGGGVYVTGSGSLQNLPGAPGGARSQVINPAASARQGLQAGVYRTQAGQFPAGTQLVVREGQRAQTAGELVSSLRGRTYEPGRLVDSTFINRNREINKSVSTPLSSRPEKENDNVRASGKDNGPNTIMGISPTIHPVAQASFFLPKLDINIDKESASQVNRYVGSINEEIVGTTSGFFKGLSKAAEWNPTSPSFFFSRSNGHTPQVNVTELGSDKDIQTFLIGSPAVVLAPIIPAAGTIAAVGSAGVGIKNFVENPSIEQAGKSTVAIAPAGLIGVGKIIGLPEEVPIEISPRSGGAAVTRATENSLSSTQRLVGVAKVDGKIVPVESNVLLTGERVPGTDFFTTRVEVVSAIPTEKGLQFSTQNFAGPLNTRNSLLSLSNREATQFFGTQTGKGLPVMGDTVSVIDRNPSRYINLRTNEGSVMPVVKSTGESNILSESNIYNKVQYKNVEGLNLFGDARQSQIIESNTGFLTRKAGGANTDLFRGTFQNLERAGLYKDPYIIQGKGQSLLASRRGSVGGPAEVAPEITTPTPNFSKGSAPKEVRPIDLSGLELSGKVSVAKSARAPFIPLLETPEFNNAPVLEPTITPIVEPTPTDKDQTIITTPDTVFLPGTTTDTSTALSPSTGTGSDTVLLPGTTTTTSPIIDTQPVTKVAQSSAFKQSLSLEQQYLTKSQTGQDTILRTNAGFFNEQGTKKEEIVPLLSYNRRPKAKVAQPKKERLVQGYDVLLKKDQKFQLIGRNLTRNEALRKGESAALGSLAATFKIQKTGQLIKDSGARAPNVKQFFRDYQIKNGQRVQLVDTFIQRRGQRLVTQAERSQIKAARNKGVRWL